MHRQHSAEEENVPTREVCSCPRTFIGGKIIEKFVRIKLRDNSIIFYLQGEREKRHPRRLILTNSNEKLKYPLVITEEFVSHKKFIPYPRDEGGGGERGGVSRVAAATSARSPRPVVPFYLAAVSSAMHRRCTAAPNPPGSGGRIERRRGMLMPLIKLRNRFISRRARWGGPRGCENPPRNVSARTAIVCHTDT